MNNLYKPIIKELEKQLDNEMITKIKNSRLHLGIFIEPYITLMFNGTKTIEARISINKIIPFNKITKDDVVIIKKSGGPIVGLFTIKEVLFFDLNKTSINDIKAKYQKYLCATDEFLKQKQNSNYATLMVIEKIYKLKPFNINKKGRQTWIILN